MFAVIFIPDFSLQAVLRHEPELRSRAVALVDPVATKPCVIQLTHPARAMGVIEGQTSSQAIARCGKLLIKTRSRMQEESATQALLQTAYAFSPRIESTAPGVCTLDLKGLNIEFDPWSVLNWAGKLIEALAQFHLEAQVGFAVTPDLARLAACSARPVLMLQDGLPESLRLTRQDAPTASLSHPMGESAKCTDKPARQLEWWSDGEPEDQLPITPSLRSASAPLPCPAQSATIESFPIAALEPPQEIGEILQRWGIHTVGAFIKLGKERVAERLGAPAMELFDRVSVHFIRPLKLVPPPEDFSEQTDFETEIETVEPLLFVLRRFVEQLSSRVQSFYLVIAEFHLRLVLSSGANYERTFRIPAPTANVETLFQMLHTHLETVRTDSPIVSLQLGATPCKPEAHQFRLFESTLRDPNQFARTVARLMALCSGDRVGTPRLLSTHRPDAFRMEPPKLNGAKLDGARSSTVNSLQEGKETAKLKIRLKLGGPQLRRFRPAVSAHIEFRDRRPALLRSAAFTGPISNARGPYLSSGDWWERNRWAREEWDVETRDGSLWRIFRSSDGDFVEGVYD